METHPFEVLSGETGSASISGGCVAPVSLHLTFRIETDAVVLTATNERYIEPHQAVKGERRISLQRYQDFVEAVRAVFEGPAAEPTYSTGQLGVGVSLPMPGGLLVVSGHEMNTGPDPRALAKLTDDLVYEAWGIEPPPALKPCPPLPIHKKISQEATPKDTRSFDMARRYAPFLMPLSVFALAAYFTLRAGSSDVGEDCATSGDCVEDTVCNTTDPGWFWILGMEGYCTRYCDAAHPCPANMECRRVTIRTYMGTTWAPGYRDFTNHYCVPRQ